MYLANPSYISNEGDIDQVGKETSKAFNRRLRLGYFEKYLTGNGIDIGAGDDVLVVLQGTVQRWDKENGDAHTLTGIPDNHFDFVYSSHCLEHLSHPEIAVENWVRVLKPGGYLFFMVPDADLYEQGVWPSRGNGEHKHRYSIDNKHLSVCQVLPDFTKILSIQLCDAGYDYDLAKKGWRDQSDVAEVGIEVISQKL
jgi:SAM-dependent methyltransferase